MEQKSDAAKDVCRYIVAIEKTERDTQTVDMSMSALPTGLKERDSITVDTLLGIDS